ncbi:MAG: hypothetical protein ACREE4_23815, partial [Stellaceae bacterium]
LMVHPSSDNRMARARSASSRSDERAKARNPAHGSALAKIHDGLNTLPHRRQLPHGFCHVWTNPENPA